MPRFGVVRSDSFTLEIGQPESIGGLGMPGVSGFAIPAQRLGIVVVAPIGFGEHPAEIPHRLSVAERCRAAIVAGRIGEISSNSQTVLDHPAEVVECRGVVQFDSLPKPGNRRRIIASHARAIAVSDAQANLGFGIAAASAMALVRRHRRDSGAATSS